MSEMRYIAVPAALESAVVSLIAQNRSELIRATVPDDGGRDELLELEKRITALGTRDPDLVGAWGLGCGAGCITDMGLIKANPFRR